jgi:hypothetical protein
LPHGIVLQPDAATRRALIELSHHIGSGSDPIMLLGEQAPPHVSILHFEATDDQLAGMAATAEPYRDGVFDVKVTGLLYSVVPPGDYYVPQGGYYFGLEIIRRPDLNAIHADFVGTAKAIGSRSLGLVDQDYRPHITLGMTAAPPGLPQLEAVPAGVLRMTMAFGRLGPHGTFPSLEAI